MDSDKKLAMVALNLIRIEKGEKECPLSEMDFNVQISHSPTDNLMVKTQALINLLKSGIHPLVAIRTCGLWADSEKVFLNSKSYLDVIYKTIDDAIKEKNLQGQLEEAQKIISQMNVEQQKQAAVS